MGRMRLSALSFLVLFLAVAAVSAETQTEGQTENQTGPNINLTQPLLRNFVYDIRPGAPWTEFVMPHDQFNVRAADVISHNPTVLGITYYDHDSQRWIPYLNIGQGVGRNFVLAPGYGYKFLIKQDVLLHFQEVIE